MKCSRIGNPGGEETDYSITESLSNNDGDGDGDGYENVT